MVRKEFGLEVFTHALPTPNTWPPTGWSHDRAAWTVEAKFIVNDYGLRNRLAIITETPGQPTFERRIYAQYAYITALLDYTNTHAQGDAGDRQGGRRQDRGGRHGERRGRQLHELARRRVPSRAARSICSAYRTNVAGVPRRARASSARGRARRPASRKPCTAWTT